MQVITYIMLNIFVDSLHPSTWPIFTEERKIHFMQYGMHLIENSARPLGKEHFVTHSSTNKSKHTRPCCLHRVKNSKIAPEFRILRLLAILVNLKVLFSVPRLNCMLFSLAH